MKADISRPTARKYLEAQQPPDRLQVKHTWRTRPDPLAAIWPHAEAMLRQAPELKARRYHSISPDAYGELVRKITALEKRAGKAGMRYGCDLDVRLTS